MNLLAATYHGQIHPSEKLPPMILTGLIRPSKELPPMILTGLIRPSKELPPMILTGLIRPSDTDNYVSLICYIISFKNHIAIYDKIRSY